MARLVGLITGSATAFVAASKKGGAAVKKLSAVGVKAGAKLTAAFTAVADAVVSVAKVTAAATTAFAAFGIAAVANFAKFERQFASVRTLVDESQVDIERLSDGVRRLSRFFGEDLANATKAAYDAISAGTEPAKVVEFLGTAFKTATAGATDVATATDLLTSVLNAFALEAKDVTFVSDILFATIEKGKTTAEELAGAIGQVAPISAAAGVELEELGAALAAVTASGIKTDQAATALKAVISGIIAPSGAAAKELASIGVTADSLRARGGLLDAMTRIRNVTGGMADQIARFLPNIRAQGAAAILAGKGFEKFEQAIQRTRNATGATETAFEKMANTIAFRFTGVKQTLIDAFRTIGEALAPAARTTIDRLQVMADAVLGLTNNLEQFMADRAERIQDAVGSILDTIGAFFRSLAEQLDLSNVENAFDALLDFFTENFSLMIARAEGLGITVGKVLQKLSEEFLGTAEDTASFADKLTALLERINRFFLFLEQNRGTIIDFSQSVARMAKTITAVLGPIDRLIGGLSGIPVFGSAEVREQTRRAIEAGGEQFPGAGPEFARAQAESRARSQGITSNVVVNVGNVGNEADARAQARALAPEIERAARRGISGGTGEGGF